MVKTVEAGGQRNEGGSWQCFSAVWDLQYCSFANIH